MTAETVGAGVAVVGAVVAVAAALRTRSIRRPRGRLVVGVLYEATKQEAQDLREFLEAKLPGVEVTVIAGYTGLVLDPPQVRITIKGLTGLHTHLGGIAPLALHVEQAAS